MLILSSQASYSGRSTKESQDFAAAVQLLRIGGCPKGNRLRKEKALNVVRDLESVPLSTKRSCHSSWRTTLNTASIKDVVFKLKSSSNTLVILGNVSENKVTISIGVSDGLVAKGWHAGNAVKALAKHIKEEEEDNPLLQLLAGKIQKESIKYWRIGRIILCDE